MKKIQRPVRKVNCAVLGLDVHQSLIAYAWLDAEGEDVREGTVQATPAALLGLLAQAGEGVHVAFEAGGSSFWLYDVLVEAVGAGRVHVAQSRKIRAIANTTRKNDANDAWWLAYLTFEGRLPECYIPTGLRRELRLAVRERFEAVKRQTRCKVRLRCHLRQMGMRLPHRRLLTQENRQVLEEVSRRAGVQARAVGEALAQLEADRARIQGWEEVIEELAAQLPEVATIAREIPGVGKTLAAVLVAELGPISRFASPRAMGCYSGLVPSDRSSAGHQRHGAITREGSEHLRWALTQAAMGCLRARSGPGLAAGRWIRAKERRMGCKGKARVAGARKLNESIWRLFHLGECFDASKPFGGPVLARA